MNRIELEIKLSLGRAWLVETFAAMAPDDLNRPATSSEHDPEATWTAQDHLVHLAGIEKAFNRIIRRHLEGNPDPLGRRSGDGSERPREEVLAAIHAANEAWVQRHRGGSLSDAVAAGQQARAQTLALISELTDEQLAEQVPGAPWADGTIGGILGANADHARRHHQWVLEGLASRAGA